MSFLMRLLSDKNQQLIFEEQQVAMLRGDMLVMHIFTVIYDGTRSSSE